MTNDLKIVGEPAQVEVAGKRFYRIDFSDGSMRLLRSVTTITKGAKLPSFLDEWQMQQVEALGVEGFKSALKQKADDGTNLHKIIEEHCNGQDYEIEDEDVKRMFDAYMRWEAKSNPRTIWQERTLYSLKFGYAGRADKKAELDGKSVIIDYKSAKRAQDDHREQGSAYLIADAEMEPKAAADAVLILCLGAENKQGYTETWLTKPHEIAHHFLSFHLKNQLVSFHNS